MLFLLAGMLILPVPGETVRREVGEAVSLSRSGEDFRVSVRPRAGGGTTVVLENRGAERILNPEGGEDLFPKAQVSGDRLYVLWVRYRSHAASLGFYDSLTGSAGRILPMEGLSFIGSPVVVEQASCAKGIVFLGNGSDNDDVYFYDLLSGNLVNLTRSRSSEKKFTVESTASGIRIAADTLRERTILFFDYRTDSARVLGRGPIRPAARSRALAEDGDAARIANTYIAFGDSITWGKMRMDGLEGEYHPDLAYPAKMTEALDPIYGPAYPVNLGVPGETTYDGALRVESDLAANPGAYFLLMMGTNDVVHNVFSVDGIMENIAFLIDVAEASGLQPVISTIPPRKDALGENPVVHQKMIDLNGRIAEFAAARALGLADTFGTFMSHEFPDGWKALLEDSGGNHPSPAGHELIAGLFAERLAALPPPPPTGVTKSITANPSHWRIRWDACLQSDFSCYRMEYGMSEAALTNTAVLTDNDFVFPGFISRKIFYRIQTVDKSGYRSDFSGTGLTRERNRTGRDVDRPRPDPRRGR